MKEKHSKTVAILAVAGWSSLVLCCFTAGAGATFAQGGRTTPLERRTEVLNRQGVEKDLEKSSRELKGAPERPEERKRALQVAAQVKHDFEGLQENYNLIVLAMAGKDLSLNLDSVVRAVADIRKYATRLKSNLALPKPQPENERVEIHTQQMEELLTTLRQHIFDFVTNPLFESHGVLDVEQGRKAGRDLDRIIELSDSIKKSDERIRPTKP